MADATISTKIKLDGEAEYKQRISEINAALGTLDSKIKLLNTTYAGNENSIKGLTEINEVLNQKILTQRDKVEQLQEMLQKSAKAYGISDTTTQKYQQQLNNAEAALVKMERALADNTSKLEAAGGAADNFSDGLADLAERTNKLGESLRGDKEQKYKQSIDQLNASIDVLDAQMRKVAAEYEDSADSADLMAKKNDILTQKIIQQANKVDLLESAFKNATEYYEIGAVETSRWEKELANAEAELYKMENQLKRNTEQMAKANEETGESAQSMGEIGDAAEEAGKGMGNLGDVVNGLTSKLGIQLPDSMKTSMNGMLQLDTTTVAVAGGFAAVAAAIVKADKALISMTKEAASNADDLLTLASVTGTTTDSVQELNYMADLTDVSFDRIKDSLKETTNKMQEAATGTGDAYEAYKRLKVEITNTDGSLRSAQDVFYDTIDALGDMKNQTERDALAMDLMSESAQELNPLIELGSEKMQEYAQEAHDMGYVLDKDALKSLQAVDDAGHAARQRRLRVGDAVAHGIAGTDLDRYAGPARELLQLVDKRHDKAVKICACYVLKVAARNDAGLKRLGHGRKIVVHCLLARHLHLLEDVVVAAADQNAGLTDAEVAHEAKILFGGAYPRRDLRELQPQLHALFERLAVFFAVDKKLRLPYDAVRPAEPRQILVNIHDLLDRVRLHGLLPVAQGCVRDPDILRHVHRHAPVVERNLRHHSLRINVALEVRLRHVLERIFVRILLQQISLSRYFKHSGWGSFLLLCIFVYNYTRIRSVVNAQKFIFFRLSSGR